MEPYQIILPGETISLFDGYNATSISSNSALIKVGYSYDTSGTRINVYFITNVAGQSVTTNLTTGERPLSLTRTGPNTGIILYNTNLVNIRYTNLPDCTVYDSNNAMFSAVDDGNWSSITKYPITYHATNGTVTGPSEAAIGDTVTATGTPNVNYGITDPTTQITVTCNDEPVQFTFNATTNTITFIMPDPT